MILKTTSKCQCPNEYGFLSNGKSKRKNKHRNMKRQLRFSHSFLRILPPFSIGRNRVFLCTINVDMHTSLATDDVSLTGKTERTQYTLSDPAKIAWPISIFSLIIAFVAVVLSSVALYKTVSRSSTNNAKATASPMNLNAYAGQNVLMIAPHPDDVVGANGGFVRSITSLVPPANVSVLILTNGNAGCNSSISKAECAELRRGEEKACDAVLGVNTDQVTVLDFFDNHLWDGTYPTRSIIEVIVMGVRSTKPFAVFTFYPDPMWNLSPLLGYDDMGFHPDHQFTGKAVASAVAGFSVSDPAIYNASYGEPWSPTELWYWQFYNPTHCLQLTSAALEAKEQGFLKQRTQYTKSSDIVSWVSEFSNLIGRNCGYDGDNIAAEGFQRFV